ncbi:MAG: hypothetical protein COA94_02650 [Rickettsiales bacterium]|nr:MAG: hypothetical protein COA94_02650 [Rickettsiales bacterium]
MKNKDQPFREQISFEISDLETYVEGVAHDAEITPLANWMTLKSQIYTEGLKEFHVSLNKTPPMTIEQIREQHSKALLHDLEMITKRQALVEYNIPPFQEAFYKEINKPNDRSEEYNNFVIACSEIQIDAHFIERVSAQALLKLNENNVTVKILQEHIDRELSNYLEEHKRETARDLSRTAILLKTENGMVRGSFVEEIMTSKEINLTGEQREFIISSWQQGLFDLGWAASCVSVLHKAHPDMENIWGMDTPRDRTSIFIDTSDGEVKILNRSKIILRSQDDPEGELKPYLEMLASVNITGLTSNEFIPGCATAPPEIRFDINRINENLEFTIPENLTLSKTSNPLDAYTRLRKDTIEEYFDSIKNDRPISSFAWEGLKNIMGDAESIKYAATHIHPKSEKLKATLLKKINILADEASNHPVNFSDLSTASIAFCSTESDKEKQEEFTSKLLASCSTHQTITTLGDREIDSMEEAVVSIMTPLLDYSNEDSLRKNAKKIIRESSSKLGIKFSWSQRWEQLKDNTSNLFTTLTGGTNSAHEFMHNPENARIIQNINASLSKRSGKKFTPHAPVTTPPRKRFEPHPPETKPPVEVSPPNPTPSVVHKKKTNSGRKH